LAREGYGIAVVPSDVQMQPAGVRLVPLVHRGAPVGRWALIAWHRSDFWRHTPSSSWRSWRRLFAGTIPAEISRTALRPCRNRYTRLNEHQRYELRAMLLRVPDRINSKQPQLAICGLILTLKAAISCPLQTAPRPGPGPGRAFALANA
jgi:hypothetical protein